MLARKHAMRTALLSATMLAGLASAPAFATITVTTAYGGDVAYTMSAISPNGTSQATGVTSVVLPNFNDVGSPASAPAAPATAWTGSNGYIIGYSASVGGMYDNGGSFSAASANSIDESSVNPSGTYVAASGLMATSNGWSGVSDIVSASLILPQAQSYFGGLVNTFASAPEPDKVSFYDGSTLLAAITTNNVGPEVSGNPWPWYSTYLNVDFLNGVTYNRVVLSTSSPTWNAGNLITLTGIETGSSPMSYVLPTALASNSTVASLTSTTDYTPAGAPLPVLGGSPFGALAFLGVAGRWLLRRKRAA
jgi:hypothetical protein